MGWTNLDYLSWRSHDTDQVVHATIILVTVADVDAAYGVYTAAENNTFNTTNKRNNIAKNNANDNANNNLFLSSLGGLGLGLQVLRLGVPNK